MPAKKEKLIKITKDRDGSEVLVYEEFDPDNSYLKGKPRFVHKENDNAEEVKMQPFEMSIDELKEKQDMGLLHPSGALENKLKLKIPIPEIGKILIIIKKLSNLLMGQNMILDFIMMISR